MILRVIALLIIAYLLVWFLDSYLGLDLMSKVSRIMGGGSGTFPGEH